MKRKEFILSSAGVLIGSIASANLLWSHPKINQSNSIINIGVIGTGGRGKGIIKLLNKISGFNVIACCDVIPLRLKEGFSLLKDKNAKSYTDYKQLLDNRDIDAVLVSTPLSTHSKIAFDALDADKHVYCEKTLAKGVSDTVRLVTKCEQTKKIFQTGHQYHSSRMYSELVNLIEDGKVGKITSIESQWNRNGDWRKPVPDQKLERQINWRMYREYSSGLLAELSSHQIDFANWVLKGTPKQAIGFGGIDHWKDGRETYDNIKVVYEYDKGVKASYTCLTSNAMEGYRIMVMGDKGTLTIYQDQAWFYPEGKYNASYGEVDGVSGATVGWTKGKGVRLDLKHLDPTAQALTDFKDSILNNTNPLSGIITGAKAAYAVEMGIQAMDTNKVTYWDNINYKL